MNMFGNFFTKNKKILRDESIKIRLTKDEKATLEKIKTRKQLAPWAREVLLSQNQKKAKSNVNVDPKLIYAINRIGNNLNQITKKVNSMGFTERMNNNKWIEVFEAFKREYEEVKKICL